MEYFNRLLDEQEKEETASSQYLQDIDETYASLEQGAIENAEEIQQDKLTRKEKWESSVSQFFAPPPPQEGANAKADSELTPEEKLHREKFRATREEWKKKDPDEEVIIRVLFKSEDRCRKWLQHIGVPPETLVIHEKELEF
jgi:hypothetical protein